jgi:hypothetical protein
LEVLSRYTRAQAHQLRGAVKRLSWVGGETLEIATRASGPSQE